MIDQEDGALESEDWKVLLHEDMARSPSGLSFCWRVQSLGIECYSVLLYVLSSLKLCNSVMSDGSSLVHP